METDIMSPSMSRGMRITGCMILVFLSVTFILFLLGII